MGDDNLEGLLRKALYISDVPSDFDPKKAPQTGEEYLHRVMYEAKQCREWSTVDINKKKIKKTTPLYSEPASCISAPEEFLPTLEWQQHQIAHFSQFRLHIEKLKNLKSDLTFVTFNGESKQWKEKCSQKPKLSDLLVLNQNSLCKILNFMSEWLSEIPETESISYENSVWLYAILSCLETPLSPEMCFVLREIARKCSKIRASLNRSDCDEELYKSLNLFVCLIGRYFQNFDLADK